LSRGARAVLQFYPENAAQMELVTASAMKCGFSGGLVVDYPHSTKAKKYFLCLFAGIVPNGYQLPKALEGDEMQSDDEHVGVSNTRERDTFRRHGKDRGGLKYRDWDLKKKESRRNKGKTTKLDTKYTGRKRSGRPY